MKRYTRELLVLAALLLGAMPVVGDAPKRSYEWKWRMPDELYRELNHVQRAAIDKAGAQFKKAYDGINRRDRREKITDALAEQFKVAALEWEKLRVQAGDTYSDSVLAYVIFMQARSQHYARDRLAAIRTYGEVVDYFPNEIWIAAAALHFQAEAYFQNGDKVEGFRSLQAIAEDEGYLLHPFAAGAIRRLADNHWANQEGEEAARYWKQAWEHFIKKDPNEAYEAAENLKRYYVIEGDYDAITALLIGDGIGSDPAALCNAYVDLFKWAGAGVTGGWDEWYYTRFHKDSVAAKLRKEHARELYDWFMKKENAFSGARLGWRFQVVVLPFEYRNKLGNAEKRIADLIKEYKALEADFDTAVNCGRSLVAVLAEIGERKRAVEVLQLVSGRLREASVDFAAKHGHSVGLLHTLLDGDMRTEAQVFFRYIAGELRSAGISDPEKEILAVPLLDKMKRSKLYDEARVMLPFYVDHAKRLWADYGISEEERNWAAALETLVKLEALEDPDMLRRIRECRARIYHEHTRQYLEAVEVYRQIANPPETLWRIQDCYRRAGKRPQALDTLTELATMFPKEAAKATMTKGEYYFQDGDKKLAIAIYRQVLQRWRDSPQSSLAHQRLEDLGIKTGGGQIHEL